MHTICTSTQFSHGLRAAYQQFAHHGQLAGHQAQLLSQKMAIFRYTSSIGRYHYKLLEAQSVDVESVVAEFKAARRRASAPAKKLKAKAA